MQIFVPTSKSFQKLSHMILGRGGEGTWKVDTHVKGDDNENILELLLQYECSTRIDQQYWMTVVLCGKEC